LKNTAHRLYLDDDAIQLPELQGKDLSCYYLRLLRRSSGVSICTFFCASSNS